MNGLLSFMCIMCLEVWIVRGVLLVILWVSVFVLDINLVVVMVCDDNLSVMYFFVGNVCFVKIIFVVLD